MYEEVPQSIESEYTILSMIISGHKNCVQLTEYYLLKPEYFYDKFNSKLFECIKKLVDYGSHIDAISVINEYSENNLTNKKQITEKVLTISSYRYFSRQMFITHYRIICDKYLQRQIISNSAKICESAFNNVNETLNMLNNLYDLTNNTMNEYMFANRPMRVSELKNWAENNTISLIHSNILGSDIRSGEITTLTAKQGSAKTTYATAILTELANFYQNDNFIYFFREDTIDKYIKHFKHLLNDNVFLDKNLKYIDMLPNIIKKYKPKAIVLDGFNLFDYQGNRSKQEWDRRVEKAAILANIAVEMQVAIIVTEQYNDQNNKGLSYQREIENASIGSSKGLLNSSGKIFEIATPEHSDVYDINNLRKIILLKNRHKAEDGQFPKFDGGNNYYYTHCYFHNYKLYDIGKYPIIDDDGRFIVNN